ncbi:hypothetical protein T09_2282 [Trichinella sp. T9]|nr:hypothetical protein T09_2282 [Trichinella sp. T9]
METGGCLSNAEDKDKELATPSAARLLLYSYVQRNVNVQDNTTQYLERLWIRNHVDKYVITKHYYQFAVQFDCNSKKHKEAMGKYEDKQGEGKHNVEAPGITLRLRPRANKNLHMPLGYPPGNL